MHDQMGVRDKNMVKYINIAFVTTLYVCVCVIYEYLPTANVFLYRFYRGFHMANRSVQRTHMVYIFN